MLRDLNRQRGLRESSLWYPDIPDSSLHLHGAQDEHTMYYRGLSMRTVCLFGGGDGQLLSHLTHVIFWTIDRTEEYEYYNRSDCMAMEFNFDCTLGDGTQSMMLGQIPPKSASPQVHHFSLDSIGGERINRVDTWSARDSSYFGLTVSLFVTGKLE